MNHIRYKRLTRFVGSFIVAVVAVALILVALKQNIQLYLTPTELYAKPTADHEFIRLGGLVVRHSLHEDQGTAVRFIVTDTKRQIAVSFNGLLPALFVEGKGVVIGGYYRHGHFVATEVLAKHDANYHPPGVKMVQLEFQKKSLDQDISSVRLGRNAS